MVRILDSYFPILNCRLQRRSPSVAIICPVPSHLLQAVAITKSFAGVHALRGVSFDLLPGEVHALVGENGAGKSTLIRIVTGAEVPDSGTLTVDGRTVARLDPASARALGIAAIYQQPTLFPDFS